ncbi:MAG: transglutaminase-like domain-containing protein [bacterium]
MISEEIKALINLLDDPDEEVFTTVSAQLKDKGREVIPVLEAVWEDSLDELLQERLENLIHDIEFNSTRASLNNWVKSGGIELLEGFFLISKFHYPELNYNQVVETIEKIKNDIWLELNPHLTALEKVRIVNHVLFDVHGFSGNMSDFYNPSNSYVNYLLETKKGNPISLSILYSYLGQTLDIPVHGVNLPKNFILAYVDEFSHREDNILFYVNPFNKGAVLGKKEIDHFLRQQGLEPQDSFYQPCSNIEIIQRVVLNLIMAYEKKGEKNKVEDLQKLFHMLKEGQE